MLKDALPQIITALPGPKAKAIIDRRADAIPRRAIRPTRRAATSVRRVGGVFPPHAPRPFAAAHHPLLRGPGCGKGRSWADHRRPRPATDARRGARHSKKQGCPRGHP